MSDRSERDSCERVELLLPWHCNGTLNSTEAAEVKAHLIRCKACRIALLETEGLLALLARADHIDSGRRPSILGFRRQQAQRIPAESGRKRQFLRLAAVVLMSVTLGYVAGMLESGSTNQKIDFESSSPETGIGTPSNTPLQLKPAEALTIDGFEDGNAEGWLMIHTL